MPETISSFNARPVEAFTMSAPSGQEVAVMEGGHIAELDGRMGDGELLAGGIDTFSF